MPEIIIRGRPFDFLGGGVGMGWNIWSVQEFPTPSPPPPPLTNKKYIVSFSREGVHGIEFDRA